MSNGESGTRVAIEADHDVHLYGQQYWSGEAVHVRDGVTLHGVCPPKELYAGDRRSITQALYFSTHLIKPLLSESYDVIDCQVFPLLLVRVRLSVPRPDRIEQSSRSVVPEAIVRWEYQISQFRAGLVMARLLSRIRLLSVIEGGRRQAT